MQVIYVDEVFAINFAADYLLLLATAKISGVGANRLKMAAASVLGGIYSVGAQFSGFAFFTTAFYKMASAVVMALIVFGGRKNFFRLLLIFMAVSAAFAGAVMGTSLLGGVPYGGTTEPVTFAVFALSFAVCWAVFSVVFKQAVKHRTEGNIYKMEVVVGERKTFFSALGDTGNSLVDPMTGESVTVCQLRDVDILFCGDEKRILRMLPDMDETEIFRRLRQGESRVPFFLVPYKTVGKSRGMMMAFRPDEIYKNGKKMPGGLIGVVPDGVAEGRGYSAITGAE